MKNFRLYRIDDDNGVISIAQRKELGYTLKPVSSINEALELFRDMITEQVRQYPISQRVMSETVRYKILIGNLKPMLSGTSSWTIDAHLVKEKEGCVLIAHFMLVEQSYFKDEKLD